MTKSNYKAWEISPLSSFKNLTWQKSLFHILGWALLSPSPHNKQGWKVEIDERKQKVSFWPKKEDIGSISDKVGRQTYIGLGCFIENFSVTLSAYSINAKFEFIEDSNLVGQEVILKNLSSGKLAKKNSLGEIKSRHAYRGKFDSQYKLPTTFTKEVGDLFNKVKNEDLELHLITDQPTKVVLAEAQGIADRFVVMSRPFRQDLGKHLVPNDTDLTRVMPGNTFGLSDDSAKKVHEALVSEGQFDGDFAAGFANLDRDGIVSASALCVICIKKDKPKDWIEAGKYFEKIWLLTQKHDLGLAVMGAMVESDIHNLILKTRLGEKKKPVVVFRIGKPLEKYPHSPRVTLEELF